MEMVEDIIVDYLIDVWMVSFIGKKIRKVAKTIKLWNIVISLK